MDLAVDTTGQGDRAIVLLHAYATTRTLWGSQIPAVAQDSTVIAYDLRGFGASPAPVDPSAYSDAAHVQDLMDLLDERGIRKATLCGLSLGGHIALMAALAHPERVTALVLASTGTGYDDTAPLMQNATAWASAARQQGVDAFADILLEHPLFRDFATRGDEQRGLLRALITASSPHGLANNAEQVLGRRPALATFRSAAQQLRIPTLILVGENDRPCMAAAPALAETLPGAELVVLPGAGHFCNLEDPQAFNAHLRRFLHATAAPD